MIQNKFTVTGQPGHPNRIWIDGTEINAKASQKIHNHSPDGFSWGYCGSGPTQAALAICLHVLQDEHLAKCLYQKFKFEFVATWPIDEGFKKEIDITDFLINNRHWITVHLGFGERTLPPTI